MKNFGILICLSLCLTSFFIFEGVVFGNDVDSALQALKDPSSQINRHAAYELGESKDVRAVPALIECLDHEDIHLRRIAARALGKIGSPEAVMPLVEVLCRSNQPQQVQIAAISALGCIGDPRAGRTLEHMAEHEDGILQKQAAKNLARLKNEIQVSKLVTAN